MIGGINVCNLNANPKLQSVQAVNVVNSGAGYTVAPTVRFSGGGTSGAGAAATATIGDGVVGLVTITAGGSGYTENPTITINVPGGAYSNSSYDRCWRNILLSQTQVSSIALHQLSSAAATQLQRLELLERSALTAGTISIQLSLFLT